MLRPLPPVNHPPAHPPSRTPNPALFGQPPAGQSGLGGTMEYWNDNGFPVGLLAAFEGGPQIPVRAGLDGSLASCIVRADRISCASPRGRQCRRGPWSQIPVTSRRMQELSVKVPGTAETSYRIVIGSGLLASVWSAVEASFPKCRKFVITDANVVAAGLLDRLLQGRDAPAYVIEPAGEASKNIDTAVAIVEAMEKAYLGRDTVVLALGGGTVGDIAGFAAAIFKRGVPVVQIPTTTLAQADSAIGGKTGVDSRLSKNAFGAFWHPTAVFIDVTTVGT
ncbi:MAG: 3-dehydroquinate synthase, partial [Planctomycetes bacterium]|nr:3-dehydroquinate synthase [Planctomycetota bacterium]